jgi:hypothetical protein
MGDRIHDTGNEQERGDGEQVVEGKVRSRGVVGSSGFLGRLPGAPEVVARLFAASGRDDAAAAARARWLEDLGSARRGRAP